jgi:hypothetical protein
MGIQWMGLIPVHKRAYRERKTMMKQQLIIIIVGLSILTIMSLLWWLSTSKKQMIHTSGRPMKVCRYYWPGMYWIEIAILIMLLIPNLVDARSLETILKSGHIHVAFTQKSYDGIHKELAQSFADHLNVRLVPFIVPWKNIFSIAGHFPEEVISNPTVAYDPDIFEQCDIICNSITILHWRKKLMNFVSAFKVTELLITPENHPIKNYHALKGKRITFLESTTFEEEMNQINEKIGGGIILMPTRTTKNCYNNVLEKKADGLILTPTMRCCL